MFVVFSPQNAKNLAEQMAESKEGKAGDVVRQQADEVKVLAKNSKPLSFKDFATKWPQTHMVVTFAVEVEGAAVLAYLEGIDEGKTVVVTHTDFTFLAGRVFNKIVALVPTAVRGSGARGAAAICGAALAALKPIGIISVGILGSLKPDRLRIGHVLISDYVTSGDDKLAFSDKDVKYVGRWVMARPLLSSIAAAVKLVADIKAEFGDMISSASYVRDPTLAGRLAAKFKDCVGLDMEAFSVAIVAHNVGVPFLIIKAACDFAGLQHIDPRELPKNREEAAKNAAAFLRALLELPLPEASPTGHFVEGTAAAGAGAFVLRDSYTRAEGMDRAFANARIAASEPAHGAAEPVHVARGAAAAIGRGATLLE